MIVIAYLYHAGSIPRFAGAVIDGAGQMRWQTDNAPVTFDYFDSIGTDISSCGAITQSLKGRIGDRVCNWALEYFCEYFRIF